MKSQKALTLHFLNSFISLSDHLLSHFLNNYSLNASHQLPWQWGYSVRRVNPTTFTYPTTADVSFSSCFSSPPLPQLDRSGRITPRRGEGLTRCWALAELLLQLRVKQDVSCIPASSDSQSASMALLDSVCRQCTAPVRSSCPSKDAPSAECSEPNPECQIALQVACLSLSPKHT